MHLPLSGMFTLLFSRVRLRSGRPGIAFPRYIDLPCRVGGFRLSETVRSMGSKEKALRVLLLTSSPLEGDEGADKQLATAIADGIPQAEYLWFTRWPGDGKPRLTRGRPVRLLSKDGVPRLPERLQVAVAAAAFARRSDLIHAVMTIGGGFPVFSRLGPCLLGGRPVIHTVPGVRDVSLLSQTRPLGVTVALSDTTASELRAAGFGDVRVIPPAVALEKWRWQPRGEGPPVVLFAGHHDVGGGAPEALAAAGVAARAGARFRLVLAMRGRPGQDVRALNHELMTQARQEALGEVEILGHVSEMYRLLVSADVVLFPPKALSGKADVPLTVLEAMATGRPVILSDLPQFAILGDAVLRAPVGNSELAGGLLAKLLSQPLYWNAVADRGRKTVEERFGPERFAKRYLQLYQQVISQSGSGAAQRRLYCCSPGGGGGHSVARPQ
jgi:glycosyltransferase involved in cell wall biosynthesis